jgi:hypothetical protein
MYYLVNNIGLLDERDRSTCVFVVKAGIPVVTIVPDQPMRVAAFRLIELSVPEANRGRQRDAVRNSEAM